MEITEQITRVDFSIYGNQEILRQSAIGDPQGINLAETYNNGVPVPQGVCDRRLGVIESRQRCATCGETGYYCPGHFGHIRLAEPVFHMGYLPIIRSILSCICIRCSKLLIYKNEREINRLLRTKQGKQRFLEVRNLCKGIAYCQMENYGCGTPVHKISIEKKYGSVFLLAEPSRMLVDEESTEFRKKTRPQIITPHLCYDILRSISDEDVRIMGFDPERSRPEDMIIINFPVPPIQVRPSVKMESIASSDDDLTHKLLDIVKSNENLKNVKGDAFIGKSASITDEFMLLQFHTTTFFANDILGLPRSQQKNKKPTKSLSERLKGKEGRIRGNLMGKRVNMSGRTVITADPFISLNEVGIPLNIARILTYPEIVTPNNLERMKKLVKNGRRKYPGANFVIKTGIDEDGNEYHKIYHLKYMQKMLPLKVGDIVERHLMNGDIVLFNRQPSLHKLSMMGHFCQIIEDPKLLTFRVNVSVTEPYNADFDGDEMNIFVPQSIQTAVELRLIANAGKRFVNPTSSKIAMNAKQDTLMGSYLLSYDTTRVPWRAAMNILTATTRRHNYHIRRKTLSGKEFYSQIIPSNINIMKRNDKGGFSLRIQNGKLLDGNMARSEIANVIQKTWFSSGETSGEASGEDITLSFIDDLQKTILLWLMRHGFTVSISDTALPAGVHEQISRYIETRRKEAVSTITEYENDPYVMTAEAFEVSLRETLRASQNEIEKLIMANLNPQNGIFLTISSGSSGTSMNAGQIMGSIGQIIVEQKRIQKRFNNRTLPHFYQHDDSPFARGYCYNSFISGLNPMEFFFQVMAGREGIINTAIKTADTGYTQRKLIKFLEDVKVEYDGTVRNANNKVIQYVYGDNGINTEKQIEQKIALITLNDQEVRQKYIYSQEELAKITGKYDGQINERLYQKLISLRDRLRRIQIRINLRPQEFREGYMMPVDLQQYVLNLTSREDRGTRENKIIDPYEVLQGIRQLYREVRIFRYNDPKRFPIKVSDEKYPKFLLKVYLYDLLAPKKCTHSYRLTQTEFRDIMEYFRKAYQLARVESGEMVGFIGAQGIGEPVTQTNLKSFQKSGTGKTVAGGLVRIKELAGISHNIKTPVTRVILQKEYQNDRVLVAKIASYLKYTTLADVVELAEIVYDPEPYGPKSILKQDKVDQIFAGPEVLDCQTEIIGLPWVLRLTLSKERMVERNITLLDIKTSFCHNWSNRHNATKDTLKEYQRIVEKVNQCAILSNFDNSEIPMVHIRFNAQNYNYGTLVQFQEMVVQKFLIKGIPGIMESNNIMEETYVDFRPDGSINRSAKRYVILAEGINLPGIAQINGIDLAETVCNDIVTIYETYGVEAARQAFIREFTMAIESSDGFSNYQHIELLADAITHMGGLIAVNRHGANKLDTDPFSRASFEKTVELMLMAAAFGESDYIRSVSSRIMVGNLINGGTGCFDLILDNTMF
jgi:DNA-directed RNA polymerase II subunit RPB1